MRRIETLLTAIENSDKGTIYQLLPWHQLVATLAYRLGFLINHLETHALDGISVHKQWKCYVTVGAAATDLISMWFARRVPDELLSYCEARSIYDLRSNLESRIGTVNEIASDLQIPFGAN